MADLRDLETCKERVVGTAKIRWREKRLLQFERCVRAS